MPVREQTLNSFRDHYAASDGFNLVTQAERDDSGADRGPMASTGRFPAGTLVLTPRGPSAIEHLQQGDEFLAGDWIDGTLVLQRRSLRATTMHEIDELVAVTLRSEAGDVVTLAVGPDSPFFLPERQLDLRALALTRGDALRLANGQLARVMTVSRRRGEVRVFNLDVGDAHGYFVGTVPRGPMVLVSTRPCPRGVQGLENYLAGKAFETIVRAQLEDALVGGVVAIQNRQVVTSTRNLQRQARDAERRGVPFVLVVSPRTARVSQVLKDAAGARFGAVRVFDPDTRTFSIYRGE